MIDYKTGENWEGDEIAEPEGKWADGTEADPSDSKSDSKINAKTDSAATSKAEAKDTKEAMSELLGAAGKEARREQNLLESEEKGEDKMYVLSNRARSNGAACMIYPYVLRMMA